MIPEYFKSHGKTIGIFLFIWFITAGLGITLRLYTLINHTSNSSEDKAALLVLNSVRKTVDQAVEKDNPFLSRIQKQQLAKKEFDAILHNEGMKVRQTIDRVAKQIERAEPPAENPFYLMESDSFYYYNLTENILKTGRISPQIKGSKYFNALMNAPEGYWEPLNLHPYIGFAVYKIVSFFHPGASLMEGVSYTPLVMTGLILFVFLLTCFIFECSPGVSFLSAVTLLCVPVFLRRSMFGWYKNDPTNIFFLFAVPLLFFYGLKHLDRRRTPIYAGIGCSFLLSLYSLFWQGWVFLASMILASGILILISNHFFPRKGEASKSLMLYLPLILAGTFTGVSIVFGPKEFFVLFKEGWTALQDFLNPQLAPWPDLYLAVGELLSPTPSQWLEMMGGIFFIGIGALGLVLQLIKIFKDPDNKLNFSTIFLAVFWLVGIKLSLSAQRFETLCLIPLALLFPLGLQHLWGYIKKFGFSRAALIRDSPWVQVLILAGVLALFTILPFRASQAKTPEILNKIFNKTWDEALTKIKNTTPANSIINTWWPPGHFIKAIAQRRVTFDGATINKPQAYWLANVFLAQDERFAAGLLRMLNDSANEAVDYLTREGFALPKAVKLLKRVAALDGEQAREALAGALTEKQITKLLTLTHADPPPSYLLIYNELIEDNIQFSFVGKWDFQKVEMINADPGQRRHLPSRHSPDYISFLWELAGGAPRYSETLNSLAVKGGTILFEDNIRVELDTMECVINSSKFGKGTPRSIVYESDGRFMEKKFSKANLPYSVMLIKNSRNYSCILADTSLARSLLMRLYFYGGKGLSIFEPFIDEQDATGRTRILVYKINWEKL